VPAYSSILVIFDPLLVEIFDIQTEKYTSVTCEHCKYTEFYKSSTKALSNIFDFFTS